MEQEGSAGTQPFFPYRYQAFWRGVGLMDWALTKKPLTEPSLRHPRWSQEHKQPLPDVCLGHLPHHHRQARPHHLAHPRPCAAQAAQVRILRQGLQAAAGPQEACEGMDPDGARLLSSSTMRGCEGLYIYIYFSPSFWFLVEYLLAVLRLTFDLSSAC